MKRLHTSLLILSAAVLLAQATAPQAVAPQSPTIPKPTPPTLIIPDKEDVLWTHGPGEPDTHTGGGKIEHLLFSPDAKTIYFDRVVTGLKAVDAATGAILRVTKTSGSLNSLALSADGKTLAAGTNEGKVDTWHAADFTPLKELKIGKWSVYGMAISADGALIAADPEDGPVQIWDAAEAVKLRELEETRPDGTRMEDIRFSPDAKRIATFRRDGAVEVWETATGKRLHALPPITNGTWNRLTFTPDGNALVLSGRGVRVWSFEKEKEAGSARVVPYPDAIDPEKLFQRTRGTGPASGPGIFGEMAYRDFVSPDATTVASLLATGTIALWDLKTSTIKQMLAAEHNGELAAGGVTDIAWSPDGKKICSGNQDGTIDVWELK